MTDAERCLLIDKCGEILHHVLVEVRNLSYQEGNAGRINDLADLTHNIPLLMVGRDKYVLEYLREGFDNYARKYQGTTDRYVRILDMDEATFNEHYRGTPRAWPEPAESPN